MNTLTDTIDQARAQARDLHRKIAAEMTNQVVSADLRDAATRAESLATSLQAAAKSQQPETQQHLDDAAAALKGVASDVRSGAQAGGAELRAKSIAALNQSRDALQHISSAIAAKRSAAAKQPA